MAYPGVFYSDDGQILRAMQTAADNGAMIMMHAENGIAIDVLVAQALARGETAPRYHGLTRPWETEEEATHRAIMLASSRAPRSTSCTCRPSRPSRTLAAARRRGWNVFGETCPQYLYLSLEEQLARAGVRGREVGVLDTAAIAGPSTTRTSCGGACAANDLAVVSTDHCPFCFKEQKELGIGDFSKIPNGIGASSTGWT